MNGCNRTIELPYGTHYNYCKCDKKPFIKVIYKSSLNGKPVEEVLCKMHYNALVKNEARIKRTLGFESDLQVELV